MSEAGTKLGEEFSKVWDQLVSSSGSRPNCPVRIRDLKENHIYSKIKHPRLQNRTILEFAESVLSGNGGVNGNLDVYIEYPENMQLYNMKVTTGVDDLLTKVRNEYPHISNMYPVARYLNSPIEKINERELLTNILELANRDLPGKNRLYGYGQELNKIASRIKAKSSDINNVLYNRHVNTENSQAATQLWRTCDLVRRYFEELGCWCTEKNAIDELKLFHTMTDSNPHSLVRWLKNHTWTSESTNILARVKMQGMFNDIDSKYLEKLTKQATDELFDALGKYHIEKGPVALFKPIMCVSKKGKKAVDVESLKDLITKNSCTEFQQDLENLINNTDTYIEENWDPNDPKKYSVREHYPLHIGALKSQIMPTLSEIHEKLIMNKGEYFKSLSDDKVLRLNEIYNQIKKIKIVQRIPFVYMKRKTFMKNIVAILSSVSPDFSKDKMLKNGIAILDPTNLYLQNLMLFPTFINVLCDLHTEYDSYGQYMNAVQNPIPQEYLQDKDGAVDTLRNYMYDQYENPLNALSIQAKPQILLVALSNNKKKRETYKKLLEEPACPAPSPSGYRLIVNASPDGPLLLTTPP